ncbi:hypothetical protein SAMN03159496_06624 [Rhizobium sp. NFR07]|nr:hypothetical protein SAMN03159496_06624 [Rhizobium sp. NFR07]
MWHPVTMVVAATNINDVANQTLSANNPILSIEWLAITDSFGD